MSPLPEKLIVSPILAIVATLYFMFFSCQQSASTAAPHVEKVVTQKIDAAPPEAITDTVESDLTKQEIDSITKIIGYFKIKNIDKIAEKISYPLHRQYPIPQISSKYEMKQRFSEVFDDELIGMIAGSQIKQWSDMGWRGIMLDQGALWMANSDGMITAVNHQSMAEKKIRAKLITNDRARLHSSLRVYAEPQNLFTTENYLIRIDELQDGMFRYASWKKGSQLTSAPEIILNNGRVTTSGSGGNHHITFQNGIYQYTIFRQHIREEGAPEILLEVKKNGETILQEEGTSVVE